MGMTIREEQYLAKIAGETDWAPEPKTREEELLNKIAENGEEGGLPPVTVGDNGKVLAVVEGKWNKADAPGGAGGAMKATADMIVDAGTGTISFSTCSKTGTELANAIESGMIPYLVLSMYAGETLIATSICYASGYQPDESGNITSFSLYDQSTASNKIILVYADGHMGLSE